MCEEFDWLKNSCLRRRDCTAWSFLGIMAKWRSDRIKGCRGRMKEIQAGR